MTDPAWRAVEQVMGLPISVALRGRHAGSAAGGAAWSAVVAELREVDAMFSAHRPDSWVSRHNAGADPELLPEVAEVLGLAEQARRQSGGAFEVRRAGVLDLDGVVKGWAVDRAARLLRDLDETDFCLSGGGDMVCWTADPTSEAWKVGVEDPHDPSRLMARIPLNRGAVATSGVVHRGAHIVDARSGLAPVGLASVTVIGADLTWVDIEATAAFAMGEDGPAWLRTRPGRRGLVVRADASVEVWSGAGGTS